MQSDSSSLDPGRTRVPILANPRAGTGKSQRLVESLVGFLRVRGLIPVPCWTREELSAQAADADNLRCVVAAGGDGTLLEVLHRAPGLPVALLPLGNENLVAKFLHSSRAPRDVADAVVAGKTLRTDLARIGDRLFCVMAGVGIDAEVVHRVHERRRGHINKLHYVVPTLRALTGYPYPQVDVVIEDTGEKLRGAMVFVFNIPRYAMGLRLAPGADPGDGLLDVYVFERAGTPALARYFQAILCGGQMSLPDHHHRVVRSVRIESSARVPVQTDGDPAGYLPIRIECVPMQLRLVVT